VFFYGGLRELGVDWSMWREREDAGVWPGGGAFEISSARAVGRRAVLKGDHDQACMGRVFS
jgi:hypothetical protein